MFNLSDNLQESIKTFALQSHLHSREITFILKGRLKLLPKSALNSLPAWTGTFKEIDFNLVFDAVSRLLSSDSEIYIKEAEKLISFLNQDIESVVPLSRTQLKKIKKAVGDTLFSLLFEMMPEKYEERTFVKETSTLEPGEIATVAGKVHSWQKPFSKRAPWTMDFIAGGTRLKVVFFGKVGVSYASNFPAESEIIISGEVSKKSIFPSFTNPEIFKYDEIWKELLSGYVPHYKKIPGVSALFLLRSVREAVLKLMKYKGDWLPDVIRSRYRYSDLISSCINVHFPPLDLSLDYVLNKATPFHQRLAFDKMFFFQYAVFRDKNRVSVDKKRKITIESPLSLEAERGLPFALTNAQKRVLREIRFDLTSSEPMSRLLQGDVGSGKTVVMMLAGLDVIFSGYKSVIMAPTEILARQHYDTILKFVGEDNIKIAAVMGGVTGKKRKRERLEEVRRADFIIGTHAVYENIEEMGDIGLIIVDEQHRFGVSQRMKLMGKAFHPDTLVVSATPIPRSLALTMYGGVGISILNEMPPGRTPVKTKFVRSENRNKVVEYVEKIVKEENKKGYWVCPLVEESEKLDLVDVHTVFEEFKDCFGERVKLLHGKMKGDDKEEIIGKLRRDEANILVSTVVVEVGVDIPDASFMVIENAERFGLAQIHQLRGRVGRGSIKSFSALIAGQNVSAKAEERLKFLTKTTDGFKVAEFDLKKRGPGALTGFEQSGFKNDPYFLLAAQYGLEMQKAHNVAEKVCAGGFLDEKEIAFIEKIFSMFFREKFERYKAG